MRLILPRVADAAFVSSFFLSFFFFEFWNVCFALEGSERVVVLTHEGAGVVWVGL